jgi:predicted Zn-dependent protease
VLFRSTKLVKNGNYRGISATFWRSLANVGSAEEVGVMGTPNCGKGEPNQMVRVAHACPPARFVKVQVFGGA